jgi:glycosyltransferase involved in cell wall biosynthesis
MAAEHIGMYRRIDHPEACSETIADRIRTHGIDAIPIQNGVDTEQFSPVDKTEKTRLRKEFNIPVSATVFISVGTLIPRKNPLAVIKGFQAADVEDSILLMLSDGLLWQEYESLAPNDNQIMIEGWVDNVCDYLGASDYFVSASSSEGLPNAVMEALASGLPVLLSDIQPHQEILQLNSNVGELFDLGGVNTLQNKIQYLSDKEYNSPLSEAREMIIQKLGADTMSTKYQHLYSNVRNDE